MKLIRLLLKTSKLRVILAFFTSLLGGACSAGVIATINQALKGTHFLGSFFAWRFVWLCCLLMVSTAVSQALIARLAQKLAFNLQLRLARQILASQLRHLEEIGVPRLLAALTEDIQTISTASFSVSNFCVSVAILISCFLYLSKLSLTLSCLMFIFTMLGIFLQNFLIVRGKYFFKLARQKQNNLFQDFRIATEGIKELKLHQDRRQAFLVEDLQANASAFRHYRVMATDLYSVAAGFGLLLFFIPIGLLIFVLSPHLNISYSVLSGYVLTIIFMTTPFRILLNNLSTLSQASVAIENIESLGLLLVAETETIQPELVSSLDYQQPWKSLKLKEVTHTYRGEQEDSYFILGPINLSFYPGELVFIVGGNGCGKSTLVKLLAGLYEPETGVILFDEHPITDANREWYRQQFSAIFSDFYLFERLLGLNNSHFDRKTQNYLAQLQLDHKVSVKDGVFSTTALSQGQRKRLALLTAYLENRTIYIFDEWASDQDPVFKKIFYTQLLPDLKHQGKTVLVITHDDQYFHLADRIVKLDYGKVMYDKSLHP